MDFDSDAVIDFEDVKSRGERKAVFNVVEKLKDLGPDLPSPHMNDVGGLYLGPDLPLRPPGRLQRRRRDRQDRRQRRWTGDDGRYDRLSDDHE